MDLIFDTIEVILTDQAQQRILIRYFHLTLRRKGRGLIEQQIVARSGSCWASDR